MGKTYQEAVLACISRVLDEEETSDAFLEKVVNKLDRCVI
jgi:hypothetical protein